MSLNDRPAVDELFKPFFEDYYRVVKVFFLTRISDSAEAEDLTQETFLRAYKAFKPKAATVSWLLTIAANVRKNWLRDRQALKRGGAELVTSVDDDEQRESSAAANEIHAEDHLMIKEKLLHLEKALAQLPLQMRRCFVMFYLHERKHREIAQILKLQVGTVKSNIHRARHKIVEMM